MSLTSYQAAPPCSERESKPAVGATTVKLSRNSNRGCENFRILQAQQRQEIVVTDGALARLRERAQARHFLLVGAAEREHASLLFRNVALEWRIGSPDELARIKVGHRAQHAGRIAII